MLSSVPEAEEMRSMTTIAIIGSGHVGSNLAEAAVAHGYDVVLSNSQGPDSLTGLVSELGPGANAACRAADRSGLDVLQVL
jgi:8-hydroxy-5-deazaflavin:NADPH oxidoreductase